MRLVVAVLIIAALVAGGAYYSATRGTPVEVSRVERGPIRAFIEERAETRLPKIHLITMPFNGRIEPIELEAGDRVTAGQLVAQVTPSDLALEVEQAEAAVERLEAAIRENDDTTIELTGLEQALRYVESMELTVEAAEKRLEAGKAQLDFAETNLGRVRRLAETNARTQEALDQAELAFIESRVSYQQDSLVLSALKSIQAATALVPTAIRQYIDRKKLSRDVLEKEKEQAVVQLQQARRNQKRGQMTSPVDGVVLERLESNERQVTAGTVLLRIGDLEKLEVEADLLSEDVVDAHIGDSVDIFGPAIGSRPARGILSRIYPAGFTKISSLGVEQQRVKVIISIAKDELERLLNERNIGVGYRVRVRIYTDEETAALVIPRSALFRGPAGDWQVFAVRDGVATLTTVVIGLMNDQRVQIREGLAENDMVILAPDTNLTDGARVAPTHVAPVAAEQ